MSKVWPESGLRKRLFLSIEDAVLRKTSAGTKKILLSLTKSESLDKLIKRRPGKKFSLIAGNIKEFKKFVA